MSGAGAENGAEQARKPDGRERDLEKYGGAGAEPQCFSGGHEGATLDTSLCGVQRSVSGSEN